MVSLNNWNENNWIWKLTELAIGFDRKDIEWAESSLKLQAVLLCEIKTILENICLVLTVIFSNSFSYAFRMVQMKMTAKEKRECLKILGIKGNRGKQYNGLEKKITCLKPEIRTYFHRRIKRKWAQLAIHGLREEYFQV